MKKLLLWFIVATMLSVSMIALAEEPVVTLNAGTSEVEQAWGEKWVGKWNENHPEAQVRYELVPWADLNTKVMAYKAAGTPPDLAWYFVDQITEWHKMGILEPLDEWIGDTKDTFMDALLKPTSDIIYDGKIYGAPITVCNGALAVRKDILEQYEIDPASIKTWEDFKKVVATVTNPPNQFGTALMLAEPRMLALDAGWWAVSNGLDNIADFRPEKEENYIQLLQFFKDLKPYMPPAQTGWIHRDSQIAYVNGVMVMYPTASYFFGEIKPLAPEIMSPEKTIFIPMPYGPKLSKPNIALYTVGYVMFKDAPHKKEAAEFLKFWLSKDVINEFPMNLAPLKNLSVDDRVSVSSFGEDLRWFQEQCINVIKQSDTVGLKPVIPGEESYRIFDEEILRMFSQDIPAKETYDVLRKKITALQ